MKSMLNKVYKLFAGDTVIFLLIVFLCLTSLQFACVASEQHGLQTKALAILADEGYRSKCLQFFQLILITFLVMCQVGIVKFPGAWNVKEPLFYETSQFYESLLFVIAGLLLFLYVLNLMPIYVSALRSCFTRVWKNIYTTYAQNPRVIVQLICLCGAFIAPLISGCEGRNDSAFSSEGHRPDGLPEEDNTYLIMLAYTLRFFNVWRLPPDSLMFDINTLANGIQLGLLNILLHVSYNLGSLTSLWFVVKNAKWFPYVDSIMDLFHHLMEDPSDKVVAILHAFAQTQQQLPNIIDLWILSGAVICLWLWIKGIQHKN